jgi:hypothetical protein
MARVFIDTNVPMYAAGSAHPLRAPSQRVITAVATDLLDAVTDAEVFQEILYRYFAIGERAKGTQIFDEFSRIMAGRILPIEPADVQRARALAEQYPGLSPRDLIHLAVMQHHAITEIVTADAGFGAVRDIRVIELASFAPPS